MPRRSFPFALGILVFSLGVGACRMASAPPVTAPPVAAPPVTAPAPPTCHLATAEDVRAGIPEGLTVCGSVASGDYSYATAGPCTCVEVVRGHVPEPSRCTPCASYMPPPPPQRPAERPVAANPNEISMIYATPVDGCLVTSPLPRESKPRLYGAGNELPRYADECEFRLDDVPEADSDFRLLMVPLDGRTISGFSVHEGVLTVAFEPIECAGGERVASPPPPAKTPVPNGRPFFKVPRTVKKVVLAPPLHRACPPAAFVPGAGRR